LRTPLELSENPDEKGHLTIQPCRIQNRLEMREFRIWQSCRVLNSTRLLEYERNLRYGKEEHAFVAGALHFWLITGQIVDRSQQLAPRRSSLSPNSHFWLVTGDNRRPPACWIWQPGNPGSRSPRTLPCPQPQRRASFARSRRVRSETGRHGPSTPRDLMHHPC